MENIYLQLYSRAAAPCRDYYGLTITDKQVILNIWNISYGPHVYPKRHKCCLEDFDGDTFMSNEIERVFGKHVNSYCINLTRNFNNLQCLPTKLFLYILNCLATNDILKLSQTSKIFFELCNKEDIWKLIFKNKSKNLATVDEIETAESTGWKNVVKSVTIHKKNKMVGQEKLHLSKSKSTSKIKEIKIQNNIKIKNDNRVDVTQKNNKSNLTLNKAGKFNLINNEVTKDIHVKEKNINEVQEMLKIYKDSKNKKNIENKFQVSLGSIKNAVKQHIFNK